MKIKILFVLMLSACLLGGKTDLPSYDYLPILMERSVLEQSIRFTEARTMVNTAKIYYYDSLIFISEKYKGIHVIDNRIPANPKKIGFINIPGCTDIAIKSDILYADNAVDLVAIDITNIRSGSIAQTSRVANVLPELLSPMGYNPYEFSASNRPKNTVIVEWRKNSEYNSLN